MSHAWRKVNYINEGNWGSTTEGTLYAHFNNTCDIVSVYDETGVLLFCYSEWYDGSGKPDMGQAIVKLLGGPFDELDPMTKEDIDFINNKEKNEGRIKK